MGVEFPRDEEGYILDENGERVLPDEPQMSKKTGKRKKAKPHSLTQAKINKICDLILEGNFIKQAVISSGVKYGTYTNMMAKGKKGIRPYCEWRDQIEKAKAQAETDKVHILNEQMKQGNVGVIQWWLDRVHPNRWGRTEKIKAQVDNSQKIEIVRFSEDKSKKEE